MDWRLRVDTGDVLNPKIHLDVPFGEVKVRAEFLPQGMRIPNFIDNAVRGKGILLKTDFFDLLRVIQRDRHHQDKTGDVAFLPARQVFEKLLRGFLNIFVRKCFVALALAYLIALPVSGTRPQINAVLALASAATRRFKATGLTASYFAWVIQ